MRNMIGLMVVGAFGMAGAACTTSQTVADNSVAAQVARSIPATANITTGNAQVAQAITSAQGLDNNQQLASILAGLAAANQAAQAKQTSAGVPTTLTIGDLVNAFNKGVQQSQQKASQPKIGIGPGVVGPGPVFGPAANGQNLNVQMVPALTTPY
jgi:hypothetical protein